MKISIVIPVYNEADSLAACLNAIAAQSLAPYEVIVVDNNSTDDTIAVAREFAFVRVISEQRQGVVYARTKGFDAARGDVIGRLDGDTIIPPNWVKTVEQIFSADKTLSAVFGSAKYYGIALPSAVNASDLYIRRRIARLMGRDVVLQGANLALKRNAWVNVRNDLCNKENLHEDFDLAIHLVRAGYRNAFDERLRVKLEFRIVGLNWREYNKYIWLSPKSYALHGLTSQKHMYPIAVFMTVMYLPLRIAKRAYDPVLNRGSWKHLLRPTKSGQVRPNPATFVD